MSLDTLFQNLVEDELKMSWRMSCDKYFSFKTNLQNILMK